MDMLPLMWQQGRDTGGVITFKDSLPGCVQYLELNLAVNDEEQKLFTPSNKAAYINPMLKIQNHLKNQASVLGSNALL